MEKKYCKKGLINGGVYLMKTTALENFEPGKKFSFETDFLEAECSNRSLGYSIADNYFIDIGIPEDYKRAQSELPNLPYFKF